jgi:hypothetical protein
VSGTGPTHPQTLDEPGQFFAVEAAEAGNSPAGVQVHVECTAVGVDHALHCRPNRGRSDPRPAALVRQILVVGHGVVTTEQDEADAILGGPDPCLKEADTLEREGVRALEVVAELLFERPK